MVHPTCASARPQQDISPGNISASGPAQDRAALSRQATAQLGALRQACHASACACSLVSLSQESAPSHRHPSPIELRALVAVVEAEIHRCSQAVEATIALMMAEQLAAA